MGSPEGRCCEATISSRYKDSPVHDGIGKGEDVGDGVEHAEEQSLPRTFDAAWWRHRGDGFVAKPGLTAICRLLVKRLVKERMHDCPDLFSQRQSTVSDRMGAMYQARRTDSDLDIVCEQHRESDRGKLERDAPVGVGVLSVELVLHRDTSNCTEIGGDEQADDR